MGLYVDGVQRQGQVCSPKVDAKSGGFCKEAGSGLQKKGGGELSMVADCKEKGERTGR